MLKNAGLNIGVLALLIAAGNAAAVTPRIISATPVNVGDLGPEMPTTRANNTIVFEAIAGPYVAFAADVGALGFDDYDSTYAEAFAFAHLQRFRFVGGVLAAGQTIQVQFYNTVDPNPVNTFDLVLPQAGNFIWNIALETAQDAKDSTFAIPPDGYVQLVCPAGSQGMWFLSTTLPAVGTESRVAGEGSLTTHSHRFELTTSGGTDTAPNIPILPDFSGIAAPGLFDECGGPSVVTVTIDDPGSNPVATNFAVTLDTTSIGGTPGIQMLDDGVAPDVAAGDLTFTVGINMPQGPDLGFVLPVTVSFDQGGADTLPAQFILDRDIAGDSIATAWTKGATPGQTVISGHLAGGNDVDIYGVLLTQINDNATPGDTSDDFYDGFDATLEPGGATWDTQLFLFSPAGVGLLHNDDDSDFTLQSHIGGFPISPASAGQGGLVYLAISGFPRDAVDAANVEIWLDAPDNTTRTPDGGSADNILVGWVGTAGAAGNYAITLTNATLPCPVDVDNGTASGLPDGSVDINDLLYLLVQFENGTADLDDDGDPAVGTPNCATDINDLLFFLSHFESGC